MEVTLICHNLDLFSVTLSCFFFFISLDKFVFLEGSKKKKSKNEK